MTPTYRKGDRVTALACTRLITCGLTYEVAEDQQPGEPVRLHLTPLVDIAVDPAILKGANT